RILASTKFLTAGGESPDKLSPVVRVTATPPMVTVSEAVTVKRSEERRVGDDVKVATLPLIDGPKTIVVSPPLTVTFKGTKLGVPVAAGEAVTVTVNTSAWLTSLSGLG